MAKCIVNGDELPVVNEHFSGFSMFECRVKGKELCPNYMRNMVNGKNCRLLQNNERRYSRCCLRSTLEPFKEHFKNAGTVELAALFKELEEVYLDCSDSDRRTTLRAELGAIEEILLERKKGA